MTLGQPLWAQTRHSRPQGCAPARCDAAIVGAGYTGLSAALDLTDAGMSVCVFERGWIGDGASSRNAGFCTINPSVSVFQLGKAGSDATRRWFEWFERAVDTTEAIAEHVGKFAPDAIGFKRCGSAKLAQTAAQARVLAEEVRVLAALGLHRRYLNASELGPALHSSFTGARWDDTSAVLDPGQLHLGLAEAVCDKGAVIVEACPVVAAEDVSGRLEIHHHHGVTVADRLLVATNGYAEFSIAPFRDFVLPVGSFIIATEPFAAEVNLGVLSSGAGLHTSYRFPHYFRLLPNRRFLFGGRSSLATNGNLAACAQWLHARLRELFPTLAIPPASHCWGGRLGFAVDRRPLMGRLDARRYYAMGCAGHGVPTSLAFGRDVAAHMLGRPHAPAPFWREPGSSPVCISRALRYFMPVAQIGLKLRDAIDRMEDSHWLRRKPKTGSLVR